MKVLAAKDEVAGYATCARLFFCHEPGKKLSFFLYNWELDYHQSCFVVAFLQGDEQIYWSEVKQEIETEPVDIRQDLWSLHREMLQVAEAMPLGTEVECYGLGKWYFPQLDTWFVFPPEVDIVKVFERWDVEAELGEVW